MNSILWCLESEGIRLKAHEMGSVKTNATSSDGISSLSRQLWGNGPGAGRVPWILKSCAQSWIGL